MDWFVSTIHKKSTVLSVLYVIKDLLGIHHEKEITRKEFTESLKSLQRLNSNFGEILEEINWTKLCYITKAMWCKHNNDRKKWDLTKYNIFLDLAGAFGKCNISKQGIIYLYFIFNKALWNQESFSFVLACFYIFEIVCKYVHCHWLTISFYSWQILFLRQFY